MSNIFLVGALVLAALFVVMRIARKGRGRNYEDSKNAFEERLRRTGAKTWEHTLSAGVTEQMLPVAAAIRELLALAGNPPGFDLLEEGRITRLRTPAGEVRIDFGQSRVHAADKRDTTGYPCGRWRISEPGGMQKEYAELADAAGHLKRLIFQREKNPLP